MAGFWSEITRKLAEQWFSLLALPGALYLAVVATARVLGHPHALDIRYLGHQITSYAGHPAVTTLGGQIILLIAVLAGAAVVGLIAQFLGAVVENICLAAGWQSLSLPLRLPARWCVRVRRRRWDVADAAYQAEYRGALAPDPADRPDPARRHRAARIRDRIAVERPERPTWSGDRIHAAALRLDRDHHLDLATVWPALWLILPDTTRDELTAARLTLSRATTLAAWAVLYLPLGILWWPAVPLAVVIAATARHRIRGTSDTYATLLETTTRLHATALATQLGIDHTGPLTPQLGHTLTRHLHSRPPQDT
ncbi:hypothetical protein [Nocardia carnea]|uniref:hypothetical protein n=1 Tax=Nocardia carnea TaxID=37328 RepID=UPI00245555FE|nr:hypothetical protein [Nocardia carnea]